MNIQSFGHSVSSLVSLICLVNILWLKIKKLCEEENAFKYSDLLQRAESCIDQMCRLPLYLSNFPSKGPRGEPGRRARYTNGETWLGLCEPYNVPRTSPEERTSLSRHRDKDGTTKATPGRTCSSRRTPPCSRDSTPPALPTRRRPRAGRSWSTGYCCKEKRKGRDAMDRLADMIQLKNVKRTPFSLSQFLVTHLIVENKAGHPKRLPWCASIQPTITEPLWGCQLHYFA